MRYYVRIFCNDIKVRSTGGDFEDIYKTLESFNFENHKDNPIQWYELIKEHIPESEEKKFLSVPLYKLNFRYQIVKKRHKQKKVIMDSDLLVIKNISILERFREELPVSNYQQVQDVLNNYYINSVRTFKDVFIAKEIECEYYNASWRIMSNIDDKSFKKNLIDYFYRMLHRRWNNGRK